MSDSTKRSRDMVITRQFAAPRELVFQAWTDPKQLLHWWAPRAFTTPYCTVDLRPGGAFRYCHRAPDGQEFWARGVYLEIVPPERLSYRDTFTDADGNDVPPSHYGMDPASPEASLVTVTFTEQDGGTLLTLTMSVPQALAEETGAHQGWSEMLDRLAELLAAR